MVFRDKVRIPFLAVPLYFLASVALSLSTIPITFALFAIFQLQDSLLSKDFSTFPSRTQRNKTDFRDTFLKNIPIN